MKFSAMSKPVTVRMYEAGRNHNYPDPLTIKEERRLIRVYQKTGDDAAVEKLIAHNMRFAMRLASQFAGRGVDEDDLLAEATYGMLTAVRRYDLRKYKYKFISYAVWWMRQRCQRMVDEHGRAVRVPVNRARSIPLVIGAAVQIESQGRRATPEEIAEITGIRLETVNDTLPLTLKASSLDDFGTDPNAVPAGHDEPRAWRLPDGGPLQDDELHSIEARQLIDIALSMLTPRERNVVTKCFGLDGHGARTLEAIAQEYGYSRERIRQVRNEALAKLRKTDRFGFLWQLKGVA